MLPGLLTFTVHVQLLCWAAEFQEQTRSVWRKSWEPLLTE